MGKTSLHGILRDHFGTLRDGGTEKLSIRDFSLQLGAPIVGGAGAGFLGFQMTDVDPAVAGISIVAGLLFAVAIFLFQLRITLPPDPDITENDKALIDETMSNVLWAILWGFGLVLYLVVCGSAGWLEPPSLGADGESAQKVPDWMQKLLSSIAVGAAIHFVIVLAMCLKRIRRAYRRVAMKRQ